MTPTDQARFPGWKAVAISATVSVLLHITLGWPWTALAAILAGFLADRAGWLKGGLALMLGWGVLIGYTFAVARQPAWRLAEIFGGLLGNMPGAATVALTLIVAGLIGALGGVLGTLLSIIRRHTPSRRHRVLA